nr:hypothetical protein [Thiothrix nivea]
MVVTLFQDGGKFRLLLRQQLAQAGSVQVAMGCGLGLAAVLNPWVK